MLSTVTLSRTTTSLKTRPGHSVAAWMAMVVSMSGRDSGVFCEVDIVDADESGITITWEYCFECTGYSRDSIHPRCLFCAYDFSREGTRDLLFTIEMPDGSEPLSFKAKADASRWFGCGERIHLRFTKITSDASDYLKNEFRKEI